MGAVVEVLALVVVVMVVVGVALILRGRGGDEVHSVEDYRHTLQTLQGLRAPTSVKVLPRGGEAEPEPPGPRTPPEGTPLRFDAAEAAAVPEPTSRQRNRAMSAMNHRPRRMAGPLLVAVAVIGVVVVLVAVGSHQRTPATKGHVATTVTTGQRARGHHRPSTTTSTTSTTTTVPPQYQAVSSTATSATYVPPASAYRLSVATTTGSCWVQITQVATGQELFARTLAPGQSEALHATGTVSVLLGAPSAAVTVGGVPVVVPPGSQTPFTMTFRPAGT